VLQQQSRKTCQLLLGWLRAQRAGFKPHFGLLRLSQVFQALCSVTMTGHAESPALTHGHSLPQHWSMRVPWQRKTSLWGGWVVRGPRHNFWFAGDTGYAQSSTAHVAH
jgi:hypothetical protein